MAGSDENNPGVVGGAHVQEGLLRVGAGKIVMGNVQQRRALSNINSNIIGPPPCPCAINKRVLSEQFAAQMAYKQQLRPEESTKMTQSVSNPSKYEDCAIFYADADKMADDFPVPMYVQHTESILEETDQMEEVEMEDVAEEPVMDIDSCDKENQLAVVEYVDYIYEFSKKAEVHNVLVVIQL